jgi:transposase InsO family protein
MRLHANAALSLNQRSKMVWEVIGRHRPVSEVAAAFRVSEPTCRKWVRRFGAEGAGGLHDRSSAPRSCPHRTPAGRVEAICALRRLRMSGPEIAELLDMAPSTVSAVLTRAGLGRLGRLGLERAQRYERERPGELVHIDIKKLGRIDGAGKRVTGVRRNPDRRRIDAEGRERRLNGWDFVHVAIDDATRLAYAEVLPDETATTAVGFLRRALRFYASYGITVERVLTDNGAAYRSAIHAVACRTLGIRHLRTRPRRPQTNGKAERFIRTMLGGWAYGAIYRSSSERTAALDGWLWHYNHRRRHSALSRQTPAQRHNNLAGTYI